MHTKPTSLLIAALLALVSLPVHAEDFTRDSYSIPVTANGLLLDHPFSGGLYNPMHQFADIDSDGDQDLFLFETGDGSLSFYRNVGSPSSPSFQFENDPFPLPDAFGWFRLVDIDGDDRLDFLTSTIGGNALTIFTNTGTEQVPDYELLTSALLDSAGVVVYCESFSIAACADMDADGDLDFLSLNTSSGTINYYENIGSASNFLLAFRTDRYQDIQICIGCGGAAGPTERHGNGSMHFEDMDADNDLDMLYGDLFHTGLYYFENVGTPQSADLDSVTAWFPLVDPVITFGYNQPTLVDIDGDNDKDLFVSVLSSLVRNDNFRFYTNTGDEQNFQFELTTANYLETLDLDLQSAPAFADIDADGDQDLFVGNLDGKVAFLRNTGSAQNPAFLLEDSAFVVGAMSLVLAPTFADIDGDADQDMFLGHHAGKVEFHRNNGTAAIPAFERELWLLDTLTVGFFAAPSFFDADADGDLDLFIGKSGGGISYFRNTGTTQLPRFVLESTTFAGIIVGLNAKPHFVDEDNDGDRDLLVGASDGLLHLYRNDGPPQNPVFTLVTSTYAAIDTVHECAPAMADLDADGDQDLIIGCQRGGLAMYRNNEVTAVEEEDPRIPGTSALLQNYPNPFNPRTEMEIHIQESGHVIVRVFDILGRVVATLLDEKMESGTHRLMWDAQGLTSGVYLCRLQVIPSQRGISFTATRKMILLR